MTSVGILAMEVYFPTSYVDQEDLEKVTVGSSAGKHTIGLGQDAMAFTGDNEDVNSIALTVVSSLMEKYSVDPTMVGRLEVGTETIVDKSKSTKTTLMSLFADTGNTDIDGATVVNACYGGTSALLNALMWVDSSAWDGRYAIVVAADIAVYAPGPARPTGGCGAIALLVGRDAPLAIDVRTKVTHAAHVWDFYKPRLDSEYPEVNGNLSQHCYMRALDDCYMRFVEKQKKVNGIADFGLNSIDYFLFHSPYNKLVQKAAGRLLFHEMIAGRADASPVAQWKDVAIEHTVADTELEQAMRKLSADVYAEKVALPCEISKQIGNTYTASLYVNLAYLVSSLGNDLNGKSVAMYSYGSGSMATMYEIKPTTSHANQAFTLDRMKNALNLKSRLESRNRKDAMELEKALMARERVHNVAPFTPTYGTANLLPGSFYLAEVTHLFERKYKQIPRNGISLDDLRMQSTDSDYDVGMSLDEGPEPASRKATGSFASTSSAIDSLSDKHFTSPRLGLRRSNTVIFASGRPNVKVVVTGISAALPGRGRAAFEPGVNNIQRIIQGENFIAPIPYPVRDDMLQKNVVELLKKKDGTQEKRPVDTYEKQINLCAALGDINLSQYGVAESIAATMDRAVQVAVCAGLEALKNAGVVTGEGGVNGWVLPESMQATTGVVYATSFPALDAAIQEVSRYYDTKMAFSTQSQVIDTMNKLRSRLESTGGPFSENMEKAFKDLHDEAVDAGSTAKPYEFDRKFLFRVLVLGNAQLAQIIKARGPNMQTNAACAGCTQAVALAYDMIQVGRAERVVVIAGDNASSDVLMPWLGNGFRALGAATIAPKVELACLPFQKARSGMILGSGGIGMMLESEAGARRRFEKEVAAGTGIPRAMPFLCRLLGTLVSNSAYHGAAMDRVHIAAEMERFISSIENELNIPRQEIARNGVYFSHETSTHASPTSSCAANELYGLRKVFGENMKDLLILNTKGFTGHPMGVSFEDVVACEVLTTGTVPPIANFVETDPALGDDLKLSRGGAYPCKYALRFAAGFGSHVALALYGSVDHNNSPATTSRLLHP